MEETKGASAGLKSTSASDKERWYKVVTRDEIRAQIRDMTKNLAEKLPQLSGELAEAVLRQFSWSCDNVVVVALEIPDSLPKLVETTKLSSERLKCAKCNGKFEAGRMTSVGCSHYCCRSCWSKEVDAGLGMTLECPDGPACFSNVAMTWKVVRTVAGEAYKGKYDTLALRSYVESNQGVRIKWCPTGDVRCGRAVQVILDAGLPLPADSTVLCDCKHRFCWTCKQEAHWPVSCATAQAWWLHENGSPGASQDARYVLSLIRGQKINDKKLKELNEEIDHLGSWLRDMAANLHIAVTDLDFITKAYEQIAECYRAFEWVHACCYFQPEYESKQLEELLKTAVAAVNRLHDCTNKEKLDIISRTLNSSQGISDEIDELIIPESIKTYLADSERKIKRQTLETEQCFGELVQRVRDFDAA